MHAQACGPGSPESSKSYSDAASRVFTFACTGQGALQPNAPAKSASVDAFQQLQVLKCKQVAVLLAPFPSAHTPVVAATACLVPFLLDPAAALGRPTPWAHEVAMSGSCPCVLAWCVVCGVHAAASV